jgi:hypothetical protein
MPTQEARDDFGVIGRNLSLKLGRQLVDEVVGEIDGNGLCTASTAAARANMKLAQQDLVRPCG